MYLVELQATPGPNAKNADGMIGAHVNCWINFPQRDGAELLAKHYVEQYGWEVTQVDEVSWVEREQYEADDSLQYFREAMEDGVSVVLHMYSNEHEE